MSASTEATRVERWSVALRLGRRDATAHKLRSALVVMLVAVATGVVALPAVALARALTPGAVLGISGTRIGIRAQFFIDPATFATLGIVGAVAAVQAVVLITPAFLLGVRRRVRELGMLSAAGASPSDLRRAILAPGLLCGVAGAAIGGLVAYALVTIAIPIGTPRELLTGALGALAAVIFGTGVAVAAAWYPAIVAMRDTDLGARRGGGGGGPPRRRAPWILPASLVAVAAGAVLAVQGAASRPVQVIAGVVVAEAGLIAALAVLVGALERVPVRRPIARFVLRDSARHRLRVLPAIAAGLAMVALASAAMVYQQTQHADEVGSYVASAPIGSALVLTADDDADRFDDLAAVPGVRSVTPVRAAAGPGRSPLVTVDGALPGGSMLASEGAVVGDRALVAALGLPSQVGDDLVAGRVLVPDADAIEPDGTVRLAVLGAGTGTVAVPAVVVEGIGRYADVVLSDDAADELGLTVRRIGAIVSADGPLDRSQISAISLAAGSNTVLIENGPPDFTDRGTQYGLLAAAILAVLLVVWVTTSLAAQEARADLETLEAIGAPPGTRRRIAAGQAALVATAGAWCGAPAGIALGALLIQVQTNQATNGGRRGPDLSVPWLSVAALLVVLPVVVALLSALTTSAGVRIRRHPDR